MVATFAQGGGGDGESGVEVSESPQPAPSPASARRCDCGECDGEGRVIGGIGSVPGFGWWPIKAYRPCTNFIESGKTYQRKGQILDKIMFGRDGEESEF